MEESREPGRPVYRYDRSERMEKMDPEVRRRMAKKGKGRLMFANRTTLIILADILIVTLVFLFVSPLIRRTMAGERTLGGYTLIAEAFHFDGVTRVSLTAAPGDGAEPLDMEIGLTGSPGGGTTRSTIFATPSEETTFRVSYEGKLSSIIVWVESGDEVIEWKIPVRDDEE
jgi:hypothetical protein